MGLDNCCCCISLKVGTLIIGYLSLVGNIIGLLRAVIGMFSIGAIPNEEVDAENAKSFLIGVFIGVLLVMIINLTFNILLLVGVNKHKPGHVMAYIVYNGIIIALNIIGFIVLAICFREAVMIILFLIVLLIQSYLWLVVKSYHSTMVNEGNGAMVYKA